MATIFRIFRPDGTKFDCQQVKFLMTRFTKASSRCEYESLTNSKQYCKMNEQEINRNQSKPSYHKLNIMVKRQEDQLIRTRSFQARNERIERIGEDSKKGKNVSVERKSGECFQCKTERQCTKGDACSFRHDDSSGESKRNRPLLLQGGRYKITEENCRKGSLPEAVIHLKGDIKKACTKYFNGNCTYPSCDSWHPPACQNHKSESGCRFGEK